MAFGLFRAERSGNAQSAAMLRFLFTPVSGPTRIGLGLAERLHRCADALEGFAASRPLAVVELSP